MSIKAGKFRISGVLLAAAFVVASCTGAGPRLPKIRNSENAVSVRTELGQPFALIDVNEELAKYVSGEFRKQQWFPQSFPGGPVILGVGDTIQISIVTTDVNGYTDFTTNSISPISSTTLPTQTIRETGKVNIPPLGEIPATGRTVSQLEKELTDELAKVLVDPTVIVQLVDRQSARVYLTGDVAGGGRVSLNEVDTQLVDIITSAGGPTGRLEDLEVLVSRAGQTFRAPLDDVFSNPGLNLYLRPDDVVTVQPPERKVVVLGATGNTTFRFDEPDTTLTELIGQSGGIDNRRANRWGVLVYRRIPRAVAEGLSVDMTSFTGTDIPAIFRFDFTEPTIYFTANSWLVEEGDVLYIADNIFEEISTINSAFNTLLVAPTTIEALAD